MKLLALLYLLALTAGPVMAQTTVDSHGVSYNGTPLDTFLGNLGTASQGTIGTSGATVPLLNGTNSWSGAQTFSPGTAPSFGPVRIPLSAAPTTTVAGQTLTFSSTGTVSTVNGSNALLFDPNTIYAVGSTPGVLGFGVGQPVTGTGIPGGDTVIANNPPGIAQPSLYFFRAIQLSAAPTTTQAGESLTVSRVSTGNTMLGSTLITNFVTTTGTTNAASAAGTNTLQFASRPVNADYDMRVFDATTPTALPGNLLVRSISGTGPYTVQLSANIIGPGVGNGDTINFVRVPTAGSTFSGSGIPALTAYVTWDGVADTVTMTAPATATATGVSITNSVLVTLQATTSGIAVLNPSGPYFKGIAFMGDSVTGANIPGGTTVLAGYTSFPLATPATATATCPIGTTTAPPCVVVSTSQTVSGLTQTSGIASVTAPFNSGPYYVVANMAVSGSGIPGGTTVSGPFTVDYTSGTGAVKVGTAGFSITPDAGGLGMNLNPSCSASPTWGSCDGPVTVTSHGTLYWGFGRQTQRNSNNAMLMIDQWAGPRAVQPWVSLQTNQWIAPPGDVIQPSIIDWRSACQAPSDITGSGAGCALAADMQIGLHQYSGDDGILGDAPNVVALNAGVNVDPICGLVSERNIPAYYFISPHNPINGPSAVPAFEVRCNGDVIVNYGRLILGNPLSPITANFYIDAIGNTQFNNDTVSTIAIGNGTPITKTVVYTPTLTPAAVAASTCVEQTFTVTGLSTADKLIVNGPAPTAGVAPASARTAATNSMAIDFCNPTAGSLTPSAGVYSVIAVRS